MRASSHRSILPAQGELDGSAGSRSLRGQEAGQRVNRQRPVAAGTRRWQEDNREAIEAHNRFVEKHGLFNDIRKRL
ncbi:MAG: type II toxin-antitoxin system CcdA family antitoxin [Geminicoccaceae bacterium]